MTLPVWYSAMVLLLVAWPLHNLAVALAALRSPREHAPIEQPELVFWIVIPALNEERVISRTVQAALALDAPPTPVRVLVVDDASTDATPDALAAIDDPRLHVLRRELPDARRGKGEALNAGYRYVREQVGEEAAATVLGVIDGDGRASPGTLRAVSLAFADPEVCAVQGRVRIHNRETLLGLLQDMEFCCVADASQRLRDRLGSVGLGGNGQFVRLAVLADFGDAPWSSCLVEDLELGLRLHLIGYRIRYRPEMTVTQQGVTDPRRLVQQRARWAQGNLQCARYLSGLFGSRQIGSIGLLDFLQYLIVPWLVVPLSMLVLVVGGTTAAALASRVTIPGLVAAPQDAVWAVSLWIALLALPGLLWATVHRLRYGDEPLSRCLVAGLAYPGFLLLGVLATWLAMMRYLARRNSWAKTERVTEPLAASHQLPKDVQAQHRRASRDAFGHDDPPTGGET
ncbi:MAG: glycosyltransferase family 2 protein [Pseudonocardiaceae bacterium]